MFDFVLGLVAGASLAVTVCVLLGRRWLAELLQLRAGVDELLRQASLANHELARKDACIDELADATFDLFFAAVPVEFADGTHHPHCGCDACRQLAATRRGYASRN